MHRWSHPVYGLNVSFAGQVQRPERQGSKLVIRGTISLSYLWGLDRQKLSQLKKGNLGLIYPKKRRICAPAFCICRRDNQLLLVGVQITLDQANLLCRRNVLLRARLEDRQVTIPHCLKGRERDELEVSSILKRLTIDSGMLQISFGTYVTRNFRSVCTQMPAL